MKKYIYIAVGVNFQNVLLTIATCDSLEDAKTQALNACISGDAENAWVEYDGKRYEI